MQFVPSQPLLRGTRQPQCHSWCCSSACSPFDPQCRQHCCLLGILSSQRNSTELILITLPRQSICPSLFFTAITSLSFSPY